MLVVTFMTRWNRVTHLGSLNFEQQKLAHFLHLYWIRDKPMQFKGGGVCSGVQLKLPEQFICKNILKSSMPDHTTVLFSIRNGFEEDRFS